MHSMVLKSRIGNAGSIMHNGPPIPNIIPKINNNKKNDISIMPISINLDLRSYSLAETQCYDIQLQSYKPTKKSTQQTKPRRSKSKQSMSTQSKRRRTQTKQNPNKNTNDPELLAMQATQSLAAFRKSISCQGKYRQHLQPRATTDPGVSASRRSQPRALILQMAPGAKIMIFTDMPMLSRPDKTGFNDSLSFGPFLEMGSLANIFVLLGHQLFIAGIMDFCIFGLISARSAPPENTPAKDNSALSNAGLRTHLAIIGLCGGVA